MQMVNFFSIRFFVKAHGCNFVSVSSKFSNQYDLSTTKLLGIFKTCEITKIKLTVFPIVSTQLDHTMDDRLNGIDSNLKIKEPENRIPTHASFIGTAITSGTRRGIQDQIKRCLRVSRKR